MVRGASASWIVRQILTLVDKAMPESSSQSYFTKSPLLLKFHTGPEFLLFCLPFVVCVCSRAARHMPWGPDRCQDGGAHWECAFSRRWPRLPAIPFQAVEYAQCVSFPRNTDQVFVHHDLNFQSSFGCHQMKQNRECGPNQMHLRSRPFGS